MHSRYIAGLCAAVLSAGMTGTGADQPLNVRLGYAADSKLLIINADDLAMSHSENDASLTAFDNKLITSATVMVPCPWFGEVAVYAKAHPDADLGLHLTLTAEWQTFRWGPVTPRTLVPSLVGPDGFFYSTTEEFARHAKVDEVETEVRAQIERARSMGLEPTHLDAHMHALYATPELFAVLRKVAREYRLPIRMARNQSVFRDLLPYVAAGDPFPVSRRHLLSARRRAALCVEGLLHRCRQASATRRQRALRSSRARRRGDAGRHRELSGLGCCLAPARSRRHVQPRVSSGSRR